METVWALVLRSVGGVFRGPGGVMGLLLGGAYGGGEGDIDSYDPLLVLFLRLPWGITGGGDPESLLNLIRPGGGVGDFSMRLL